jgi:hypothetical protein
MVTALWLACQQIASTWWRIDRLRVSPAEGRLLRIEPPARLLVGGALFEVCGRSVSRKRERPTVVYRGFCHGRAGTLQIELAGPCSPGRIVWECPGESQDTNHAISEEEIEILSESDRI